MHTLGPGTMAGCPLHFSPGTPASPSTPFMFTGVCSACPGVSSVQALGKPAPWDRCLSLLQACFLLPLSPRQPCQGVPASVSAAPCCLPRLSTGKEKGGACPVARFPREPPPPRVPQPSPLHWTQSLPKPWGHRPRSSPITGQCPEQEGSFQPRRTCRALFSCQGTCRSRSSPGHIPAAPGLPGSSVPSKPVLPAPPTGLRQPQGARNEWNVLGPGRGCGGGSMGVGHQPDRQGDPICPQTICVHLPPPPQSRHSLDPRSCQSWQH